MLHHCHQHHRQHGHDCLIAFIAIIDIIAIIAIMAIMAIIAVIAVIAVIAISARPFYFSTIRGVWPLLYDKNYNITAAGGRYSGVRRTPSRWVGV